jgi:hypothetical protein
MKNIALPCVVAWLVFAWSSVSHGQQQAPRKPFTSIEIRPRVIEVDFARLRKLGVEWDLSEEKWSELAQERPAELFAFIDGVRAADCARDYFSPCITTVAGRQASFRMGPNRFDVLPKVLDDGSIKAEFLVELQESTPWGKPKVSNGVRRFEIGKTVTVKSGKTVCVSHPGNKRCSLSGEEDSAVFFFLSMSEEKPRTVDNIRTSDLKPIPIEAPQDFLLPRR